MHSQRGNPPPKRRRHTGGLFGFLFLVLTAGMVGAAPAPHIARLGSLPDWSRLDPFQETMSREEFVYQLRHCYVRNEDDYRGIIEILPDRALILRQSNHPESGLYELRFRQAGAAPAPRRIRYWRSVQEIDRLPPNTTRPLEGLVVAIDPGHIGGNWTRWDDRHFTIGRDNLPVREGEMVRKVARLLQRDLALLGATVLLTRESNNPVTSLRPEDLRGEARSYLLGRGRVPSDGLIDSTAKAMFAISSEIRARAELVNQNFQPDIALCLHFDASPWGSRPSLRNKNHFHILINGCYARFEVEEDDTRLEMLLRILQRTHYEEVALAHELARTMGKATRLPAFAYDGTNGKSVSDNRFVWARNLLANRSFFCPVIFFEPYCMNHPEVFERVQLGEYRGLREINGVYRKNIYREYADGVIAGLVNYFRRYR